MSYHRYSFEEEPFGRAFAESSGKSMGERIALGMLEAARYRPITFPESCMLPTIEPLPVGGASYYSSNAGIVAVAKEYDRLREEHPGHAAELLEIESCVHEFSTQFRIGQTLTPGERRLIDRKACWGGTWIGHGNPDYDRLLHLGTSGIRKIIAAGRASHPDASSFYDGCAIALEALELAGDRVAAAAEARAAATSASSQDDSARREWLRIAGDFRRIPREPAFDMHSAVMAFWLFFTFDAIDSPGRLDQCMIDFYRISPPEESREMVRRMLEGLHCVRGWNLCISGSDSQWRDETNELSYLILEIVGEMGYQTPNLTMRVHRNTPQRLWELAAKSLGTGIGLPAIYNDEVVCPALEAIGIPAADAHEYCMNGCNQIDIMGKSHIGLEDGEVNMAKALSLALHGGLDLAPSPPELLMPPVGNAREARSFQEFMALYYRMLDAVTDAAAAMSNRCQRAYAEFAPNPLRSCVIQGCLEKGRDYKAGGPLYGDGQILAEGIADTADSLWAIRKLVFQERKYTMAELIQALEEDFVGHEALWREFKHCEKFGNDIPEVDELCAGIVDHLFRHLKGIRTFRGGIFTGGCSPFNRAAANGQAVAALPNGKRRGEATFADSIAAVPGCDRQGPTASLKSMMHYRQREACSGFVGQMKFTKALFCTPKGHAAFIALAKTYFANGGQQLSVNVLDRAALLAAQKEPEKYKTLVVRVGGYSDYFNNLSPELQQNVIDRTSFEI